MKTHTAQLAAAKCRRVVALRAAQLGGCRVDPEAGVIRDVAVMTAGTAKGWGFEIDPTTLQQTHSLLAAMPDGARVRFKHPEFDPTTMQPKDGTGTTIGRLRNARLVGNQIRGDVYLGSYASQVPGVGDVRSYLLTQAKEDPTAIGLSAVIQYDPVEHGGKTVARVHAVDAVDFAEDPAANPRGLLSTQSAKLCPQCSGECPGTSPLSGGPMDPILEKLIALGLDPSNTSAEAITAFVAGLTPEQRAELDAAGYVDGWAPAEAAMNALDPEYDPTKVAGMNDGTALTEEEKKLQEAQAAMKRGKLAAQKGGANYAMLEVRRSNSIRQLASAYRLPADFAERHIAAGSDIPTFAGAARAELSRRFKPTGGAPGSVTVGQDRNIATLAAGIRDGLRLRAGEKIQQPHERANEFRGLTLVELSRAYLNAVGADTRNMGSHIVAKEVFNRRRYAQLAHTTSDFSSILADTMGKSLRAAYDEVPSTWEKWCRRGTATDFKQQTRVQLSGAPDLELVKEHGEYQNGYMSDAKEVFTLAKYGKIVSFSHESIINDDLDAFSRIPQAMGQAAKRKEDDVVYYTLLKNATMNDGGALFNSTALTTAGGHANLSGASAAPTVALLNTAVAAMALQRGLPDPNKGVGTGPVLNLQPEFLLAPPALAGTVWELLNSTSYVIANGNSGVKNRFGKEGQYNLQPIIEPRLQTGVTLNGDTATGSSTFWYLAALAAVVDTMELAFLASEPAPVVEEEEGFRVDGRQYKIRHTMQAKAIDYRGLYKYGTA